MGPGVGLPGGDVRAMEGIGEARAYMDWAGGLGPFAVQSKSRIDDPTIDIQAPS